MRVTFRKGRGEREGRERRGERPLSKRGESLSDGQNDDFLRTSSGLKDSKNVCNICSATRKTRSFAAVYTLFLPLFCDNTTDHHQRMHNAQELPTAAATAVDAISDLIPRGPSKKWGRGKGIGEHNNVSLPIEPQ